MYEITARGRPAPKGSRIAARTKAGKGYTYPASKFEQPWINEVRDATKNVMRHHAQIPPPYIVDLTIRVPRPKDYRSSPWPVAHDLDKLARAVVDGLVKGGAMSDDRHVVALYARKEYAADPQDAGVTAWISAVDEAQQAA